MSGADKANNKAEEIGGKLKQAAGAVTGNRSLEQEGRNDQTKSDIKGAGEKLKDAFRR